MKKYALTSTAYKFLDIGIVAGSISYMLIAIGDNRDNVMFIPHGRHSSRGYMQDIHREADIEVNSPIIIIDSRSKCETC